MPGLLRTLSFSSPNLPSDDGLNADSALSAAQPTPKSTSKQAFRRPLWSARARRRPNRLLHRQSDLAQPREKFKRLSPEDWITVVAFPTEEGRLRSAGRKHVSIEHFRRRADECRRLAVDASNASDKAFWLGLVARWQALEVRETQQPVRDRSQSPRRRQSELSVES